MKRYLKSIIKEVLNEIFEEKMSRIVKLSSEASHRELFSYIGIERLDKILEEIKKKPTGDKYTSLAELYSVTIRGNLAKENSDIIHNYYELLPKLDAYRKAFNEVIKE
jgi:hypothetical protein